MFDSLLLLVTAAFLLAGFVKGALGLGLPTVSMGLLAVSMPPAQAIAIVIVPAIVTNIWQTFGGPYLRDIFRRLWPLLAGTAAGIWLNAGSLTGPYARYTTIALGLLLAINAIIGLCKFDFTIAPRNEKWVGGIVGLITGMISAATGVQFKTPDMVWAQSATQPIQLSTTPTFVAWTFEVPRQTFLLQYLLTSGAPAEAATPAHLYLDGALIVAGSYPSDQVPSFDDASASSGTL